MRYEIFYYYDHINFANLQSLSLTVVY
jgi:hypothetical protein